MQGLVLVDKPAGPSSFAVVRRLRSRYGVKAGHAGTLDPLASGLLLVLLGSSTRLARYLVGLEKRYSTEIRLGLRTTTGDGEGEVVEETPVASLEEIEALEGELELRVPQASAVRIEGERAYRLHRRGVAVEMPVRRSTIHSAHVVRFSAPLVELDLRTFLGEVEERIWIDAGDDGRDLFGQQLVDRRRRHAGDVEPAAQTEQHDRPVERGDFGQVHRQHVGDVHVLSIPTT